MAIFDRLIDWPGQEALVQQVLSLMRDAGVGPPEAVDRGLRTLLAAPHASAAYEIQTGGYGAENVMAPGGMVNMVSRNPRLVCSVSTVPA